MSLPRNTMHSNALPKIHGHRVISTSWLALVIPITLVAGCASGPNSRDIIDYTVSESEYNLAMGITETPLASPLAAAALSEPPPFLAEAPAYIPEVASQMTAELPKPAAPLAPATLAAQPPYLPTAPQYIPAIPPNIPEAPLYLPQAPMADTLETTLPVATLKEPAIASAIGTQESLNNLGFGKSVYAAIGAGASRLNPDTSAVAGWTADDKIAGAGQVTLGVDVAKHVSLEIHSADYGSAGLSPEGRVNYHMNGASALFYVGKNLDRFRRQGLSGYARVGYSQLENTPVGNIPFIDQTSNHASFGLGAEYNTRIGLGLRADVIAYDGDVQTGQLGMLYRMGKKPKRAKLAMTDTDTNIDTETTAPASIPLLAAAMPAAPMALPTTGNASDVSIAQIIDQQEAFADPTSNACSQLNGTLQDVNFFTGSTTLTQLATTTLNNIAMTLNTCPDLNVTVKAHTDNSGSAIANNSLSKNRARQVVKQLANQGVSLNRLRPVAYGESSPIATNKTLDGRMRNRRVEIEVR